MRQITKVGVAMMLALCVLAPKAQAAPQGVDLNSLAGTSWARMVNNTETQGWHFGVDGQFVFVVMHGQVVKDKVLGRYTTGKGVIELYVDGRHLGTLKVTSLGGGLLTLDTKKGLVTFTAIR